MSHGGKCVPARPGPGVVLAALVLVVAVALPARARPPLPVAEAPGEEEALAQLARVGEAPAYRGVRFVSAWAPTGATTRLVHVEHSPGRGTAVEVLGTTEGRDRPVFLRCARPEGRGLARATLELLAAQYEVALAEPAAVAGRSAYVVEVRRGGGSLAARFWVDRRTGLMLRREVRNRRGRVVRASAFITLTVKESVTTVGVARSAQHRLPHRMRAAELASLRARGWTLPPSLPGGLTLVDAQRGVVAGRTVVHLVYSDGLSMVSVFVQRGALATRKLRGWREVELAGGVVYRQHTVPRRVLWSGDAYVYTVVADAPPRVVEKVVAGLPHAERDSGVWARMARGFAQLGAWLNPFG